MGTAETFDHTADVGLRVRGETLKDLFETAAEALIDYVVVNRESIRETASDSVRVSAESLEDLLAAWLSEIIYRIETQHKVFRRFDVEIEEGSNSMNARLFGEEIDRDRHVLDHEVKAVTKHGLFLRRDGESWLAELILDI